MPESTDGYSMVVAVKVMAPDGGEMFNMNMQWDGMSYAQLVDLEEVVGHGLISGPISLGRALIAGGATRSRK